MEENETPEFDAKPAVNKDVWLLLIILDVVAMCVLGYYLYKHFAPQFAAPAPKPAAAEQSSMPSAEEPVLIEEDALIEDMTAPAPAPVAQTPAEEPAPVAAAPKSLVEEALEAIEPEPEPAPAPVAQKKQSIIIAQGKNNKYRQVTFRWFGAGKSVAVISGFTGSKPRALKKKNDFWETTLTIAPGSYKYLYVIDGENRTDPYAEEKDGRSLLVVK